MADLEWLGRSERRGRPGADVACAMSLRFSQCRQSATACGAVTAPPAGGQRLRGGGGGLSEA